MLGALGFLVLAVAIGAFAYTSNTYYGHAPAKVKGLFTNAYYLLSLAVVVWSVAFFVPAKFVSAIVFMGDVVLLIATGMMLAIIFDLFKLRYLLPLGLMAAGLITVRAYVVPSTAYVADDLLIFDLTRYAAMALGIVFLVAWLPATLKVLQLALSSTRLAPLRNPASFLFISTILMTGFFLTARRPLMIILSFSAIVLLFALLAITNVLMHKYERTPQPTKEHHGK